MIKKSINLLGVSALLFAMGGCTTTGGLAPISTESVQQALKNTCGYELIASTAVKDIAAVATALGQGGPAGIVVSAAMVADAICASAKAQQPAPTVSRLGVQIARGSFTGAGAPVIVNGVPVHGAFIN